MLKLTKRPGSPHWYIRGRYLGVAIYRSAGTGRKAVAERLLKRFEREIEEGGEPRPRAPREASFAEAALLYLKRCPDSQVRFVKRLAEHFKDTPLSAIDEAAAHAGATALYPDAAPATVHRAFLGPLTAILNNAASEPELKGYTAPRISKRRWKLPPGRTRWLTSEEASRLVAAARDKLKPVLLLMLYTGCRLKEALELRWDDVSLADRLVTFRRTKTGHERVSHLAEAAFEAIANLPRTPEETAHWDHFLKLHTRPDGRVFWWWRYSCRRNVYREFHKARRSAGLSVDVTPHVLDHTWATWLRMGGADANALLATGRWRDVDSVLRYTHVPTEETRRSLDRLPALDSTKV